jgi:Holliday junction resolvasome RuvABC endonuclease subunit
MKYPRVKPVKPVKPPKLKAPKAVVKKTAKAVKKMRLDVLVKLLRTVKRVVWGIDMSVQHPGMTRFDSITKTVKHYFIRTRDTERSAHVLIDDLESCFFGWNFDWVCVDPPLESDIAKIGTFPRANRIHVVASLLVNIVNESPNQVVVIENYAFGKHSGKSQKFQKPSSSATLLAETGGYLRILLSLAGHTIVEMAISANKKLFSGCGDAKKEDMERAYIDIYKLPNFNGLIGLKKEEYASVPHPSEDIYDSFSLPVGYFYTSATEWLNAQTSSSTHSSMHSAK